MRALAKIAMAEPDEPIEQARADAPSYLEHFRLSLFTIVSRVKPTIETAT